MTKLVIWLACYQMTKDSVLSSAQDKIMSWKGALCKGHFFYDFHAVRINSS